MFHTKVVEKIKIHISCPIPFCRKSRRSWDNVENMSQPDIPQTHTQNA